MTGKHWEELHHLLQARGISGTLVDLRKGWPGEDKDGWWLEIPIGRQLFLVLLCYKQKQNEIELFCGKENLRARSTRETFCRIHGRPGQSRRTR